MTPLAIGTRVALHPACDEWMQGDRYGLIIGAQWSLKAPGEVSAYRVKLDSGRVRKFHPDNLSAVERAQ